jgi:hypothetical protein
VKYNDDTVVYVSISKNRFFVTLIKNVMCPSEKIPWAHVNLTVQYTCVYIL